MAGLFDDLLPGAVPAGSGLFDDLVPAAKPKAPLPERSKLAAVGDTAIEFANAAATGVGSLANFAAPGNPVSEFIDDSIVKPLQERQSDRKKAINAQLSEEIANADGLTGEAAAAVRYALADPAGVLAQAAGSFVVPGGAIKGAGMLARFGRAGAKGVSRAGLAGGVAAGAALSGGDAAGQAYEESKAAGATEEQAQAAARQASVIPAIVGGAGGMLGAERLLAGGRGFAGGATSRAIKTGLSEGVQEGLEEGVTQYEANRAVAPFDGRDPMKGVGSAATLGALMGAPIGGVTGALSPAREADKPVIDPVVPILAAGSVDDAIKAASDAVSGTPKDKPAGGGLDRLRGILPDEQRREVIGLMATANNPNSPPNVRRFAEQQIDAILREYTDIPTADVLEETDLLPTADATELTDEQRAAYVNTPGFVDRYRMSRGIPVGEATEAIPTGDAAEVEPIPAGEASEAIPAPEAFEQLPVGETADLIPTGEATEAPAKIPTGKATEIEPETIQADDLLTGDQMPYGSKTAANVRARREGLGPANVVEIPGAGWVVRPQPTTLSRAGIDAQPAGTRGTTAADILKAPDGPNPARTAGPRPADGGRGDGAAVLPVQQPADVAAGAAPPSGEGLAGGGAAGPGAGGRGEALTSEDAIDPFTLDKQTLNARIGQLVERGDAVDSISGFMELRKRYMRATGKPSIPPPGSRFVRLDPPVTNAAASAAPKRLMGGYGGTLTIAEAVAKARELEAEARAKKKAAGEAKTPMMRNIDLDAASSAAGLARTLRKDIQFQVQSYPDARAEFERLNEATSNAAAPAEQAPAQARVPEAAAPAPTLADKIKQRRAEKAEALAPAVPALTGIRGVEQQGAAADRMRRAQEAGLTWAVGIPGKPPEYEAPNQRDAEAFITPAMQKQGFVAYPMAKSADAPINAPAPAEGGALRSVAPDTKPPGAGAPITPTAQAVKEKLAGRTLQEKVERPAEDGEVVATAGDAEAKGERKFYVTMVRGDRVARLAGPFDTKAEAEGMVDRAREAANEADPRSAFDAFGVSGITSKEHKPGRLNDRLGIGATPAAEPAPATVKESLTTAEPSPPAAAPARDEKTIELRRRASVLRQLRECLA